MGIFKKPEFRSNRRKADMPEGLWQKCPGCSEVIHTFELNENQRVCPKCDYHFLLSARERIARFLDSESFQEEDADMKSGDPLNFTGVTTYSQTLKKYQDSTGLSEAVLTGIGTLEGRKLAIAVMDFGFLASTMGSVVGEKITRIVERATKEKLPVVIFCASGGARMYEGAISLMQMAKTSGALALHAQAGLPYISILTHPTTGGVTASFATLGDLIISEPRAMICFAGPRVIKETTHQNLPEGFQTAEFLEEHGLIDIIVHRRNMRATLSRVLDYVCTGVKTTGMPAGSAAASFKA
jgi:acetyl-CoA carboxylase carboxyl transferase subunit beta